MCDQISMGKGWWAGGSRLRASSLFNAIWTPFRFLLLWIAGFRYEMAKVWQKSYEKPIPRSLLPATWNTHDPNKELALDRLFT